MIPMKIKQGEDFTWLDWFQHWEDKTPVDLTGCRVYSQMRTLPKNPDIQTELAATGDCGLDYTTGVITTTYHSADTENIPQGEYQIDIWLVSGTQKTCIDTLEVQIIGRDTHNMEG